MTWLLSLLTCRHARYGRAWTIGGRTYVVCEDCRKRVPYSLSEMRIVTDRPVRVGGEAEETA